MRPSALPTPLLLLALVLACSPDGGDTTGLASTTQPATDAASSDTLEATTGATSTGGGTDTSSEPTTTTTSASTTITGSSTEDPATSTGDTTASDTTSDTTGGMMDALKCPAAIDQAILSCVAELQIDPEPNLFLIDRLFACSDPEPVAVPYDSHCAQQPRDPICALEYADFVATILPECVARAQEVLFAGICLLPDTYTELLFTPAVTLMQRRFVTSPDQLDAVEASQVLWASADMEFPVDTVEEALLATDEDRMEQIIFLDVGTDRTLVSYLAHYGDAPVGRVFLRGTSTIVGAVEDNEFTRCGVERTIEGQPCVDDIVCAPDHTCLDVLTDMDDLLAPGACVSLAPLPGEGMPCSGHDDCEPASGLLCLDSLSDGTCRPGWMRHSFAGAEAALVPGGILDIPILVAGLATVPTGAYLDLQLTQDAVNALEIRLINPLGTSTVVLATDAPLIDLDLAALPVPGDESAGGVWHLLVEDIGGDASGTVSRLGLTLDTRWD